MSLKRRVQSLEAKLNVNYITLQLKDGTVHRTTEAKLWDTFCEMRAAWSEFDLSMTDHERELGAVPNEVIRAVPLLQTILDTVHDDADGQAVNLIQVLCAGPNLGDSANLSKLKSNRL
jgi:hypothetical protein